MEEVDELAVALRHDIGKYIRHRIVHPVEQDARNKTASAIIHPTQEQAHQEGIDKLCQIGMNNSEDGCRNHDGYPMVLLAHDAQQGAEDGSTEYYLFGKRRQDADCYIAPRLLHHRGDYLLSILIHLNAQLFIEERQGDDGSQGEQSHPEKRAPRLGKQITAGKRCPLRLQEDDEGDDTAEHLNKSRKNGVTARTYCLKRCLITFTLDACPDACTGIQHDDLYYYKYNKVEDHIRQTSL